MLLTSKVRGPGEAGILAGVDIRRWLRVSDDIDGLCDVTALLETSLGAAIE
jgi:hypothetical protein